MTCRTRSRSVTMPTSSLLCTTGSEPTFSASIIRAASIALSLLSITVGDCVMTSCTVAFAIVPPLENCRGETSPGPPAPNDARFGSAGTGQLQRDEASGECTSLRGALGASRAPVRQSATVRRLAADGESRCLGARHPEEASARGRRRRRRASGDRGQARSDGDAVARPDQGPARRRATRRPCRPGARSTISSARTWLPGEPAASA